MAYQARGEAKAASKPKHNAATNAGLIDIQIEYRAIGDVALDPRNPRQHSQRQVNQIADSIREFGFVMSVANCSQTKCKGGMVSFRNGETIAALSDRHRATF